MIEPKMKSKFHYQMEIIKVANELIQVSDLFEV